MRRGPTPSACRTLALLGSRAVLRDIRIKVSFRFVLPWLPYPPYLGPTWALPGLCPGLTCPYLALFTGGPELCNRH